MNFWISGGCAPGSAEISMRPSKSSGRTSLAICAKSVGDRISALGNFIPPFGHSVIALRIASSSVGAHERWSWRILDIVDGSFPASLHPFSKRSKTPPIFSSGAPTVMSPSQKRPVFSAVARAAGGEGMGGGWLRVVPDGSGLLLLGPPAAVLLLPGQSVAEGLVACENQVGAA